MMTAAKRNAAKTREPVLLELLGPAGSGKSTLLRVLGQRDPTLRAGVSLREVANGPAALTCAARLLPTVFRCSGSRTRLSGPAVRRMARLKLFEPAVRRASAGPRDRIILDEGPIYLVAWLHLYHRSRPRSQAFQRWYWAALDEWAGRLDTVIWLDAPNAVLRQRIRSRSKPHRVKHADEPDMDRFLCDYRQAYQDVVARLCRPGGPELMQFDTDQETIERLAGRILNRLGQEESVCQPLA